MRTDQARPIRLQDYRAPDWLVETVHLDVTLDPTATRVRAKLAVSPRPGAAPAPLVLDGEDFALEAIKIDGETLVSERFSVTHDKLTIAQPPARAFTLEIDTVINPVANTQLMGLYRSGATYCTQCEAEGFRRITYFPDRPDVMAVYTTRIEADKADAPVLLANGNLVESGEIAGTGRHFAVWHDPFPKPSYLFALVGGRLDVVEDTFRTVSGRDVALRVFVEPGKADRAAYAMDALKRSMEFDERVFGREYDLDIFMIVAVSDFNLGAMENKGLNIFNDKYVLASSDTATDVDFHQIEAIIAHEYFHNWTGNRITCRDWFQLCLKEGLTVYRDQEFTADQRSRPVKRIADVRTLRAQQFVEDAGPLSHPVRPSVYREINNFYTATVYEKGAEIVRMISTLLGPQRFRAGMDLYFERHDGEAATVEQFIRCFADVSALDMPHFMRWYDQAGTPELIVTGSHDAKTSTYKLDVAQTVPPTPGQPSKEPLLMPLVLGLVGQDGQDLPLTLADGRKVERGVLTLTQSSQSFTFTGMAQPPVPSLNRGFGAPVRLQANLSSDDLDFLAAHDSDPFNRWQALQTMATRLMLTGVAGSAMHDAPLAAALKALLANSTAEPAYVTQAVALPTESDIAREIGRDVDPDAILNARRKLRASIGTQLYAVLSDAYTRLRETGPYSPAAPSAGKRALKNACLDLMAASGQTDAIAMAVRQFETADNMTDRMAALATLSLHDVPQRQKAFDAFYERYAGDPLIVDKWLAQQASIPEPGTLDRVRTLTQHPAFSFSNPNRVRSLVGTFAQANPTQFNRLDGAGHDFVADTVLSLDAKNPQLASRILSAFKSWRALEPVRRARAEAALRRIATAPTLSSDIRDIVDRALAAN